MIEPLGPNMARSIVGDDYDPAFRYELETTESGLQVIITNKETGEASVRQLTNDAPTAVSESAASETAESVRQYAAQDFKGAVLALAAVLLVGGLACCLIMFLSRAIGGA